jgi:predicted TIM-barrel fold metal-dependent hydrolase
MTSVPRIVSPDDHVVEPTDLWTSRLALRFLERGPRIERQRIGGMSIRSGAMEFETNEDGDPCDVWCFEDLRVPTFRPSAAAGTPRHEVRMVPITYEDMRPGCYDPAARLVDMDTGGIEASMCFPNMFVRFCGQTFMEAKDRELGHACVEAYNDFMVEQWSAGSDGRLVPCTILPLWDVELCVREMSRNIERGVRAVTFPEIPPYLGLPSIHSGEWDPFFSLCEDAGVVLALHIGSGSKLPTTSPDAPGAVVNTLTQLNAALALTDWLFSGKLVTHPGLKLYLGESQIGWIPFILERADAVWDIHRSWTEVTGTLVPERPSSYFTRNFFVSFFDDAHGIASLDTIGADTVMYETDYPHADTTWPECQEAIAAQLEGLDDETVDKIVRGNASRMLGLVGAKAAL